MDVYFCYIRDILNVNKKTHHRFNICGFSFILSMTSSFQYLRLELHPVYDVLWHAEHRVDRLDGLRVILCVAVAEHGEAGQAEQGVEGVGKVARTVGDATWI